MKKGFVSMAVVYSFLIVFLVLMASFLASYVNRNRLNNKLVSDTKTTLNQNYQNYLIYGDGDPAIDSMEAKDLTNYMGSVYWCKDNFIAVNDVENVDSEFDHFDFNYYPDTASYSIDEFSSLCAVSQNQVLPYIETNIGGNSSNVRSQNICIRYNNKDFCLGRDYYEAGDYESSVLASKINTDLSDIFGSQNVSCSSSTNYGSCTVDLNGERYMYLTFNNYYKSSDIEIQKEGEEVYMRVGEGDMLEAYADWEINKEHYVYWSYNESQEIGEISNGDIPYVVSFTYKSIYGGTNSTLPLIRTKISASNTIGNHEACLRKDGKLFCAKTEWLDYLDEDVNTAITKLKKKIQPLFKNNSITCSEDYGIKCVVDDAASTTITLGSYHYIYIGHGEHYCNANTDEESSCDI